MFVWLSVQKLRLRYDPFAHSLWVPEPLTIEAVQAAISDGRLRASPWGGDAEDWTWLMHVERVAYLVMHPDPTPIWVDLNLFCPVVDGNHRLAAAIVRGDAGILAEVHSGLDKIAEYAL